MEYVKWYETSIGCNGEIDFEDTVKDNMNIQDDYCLVKRRVGLYMTIIFNITTGQRLNRSAYYGEEYQCYHYKPAKQRVQEQMEERVLRLILNKVTGDETFTW
jgi:hypothetical protein